LERGLPSGAAGGLPATGPSRSHTYGEVPEAFLGKRSTRTERNQSLATKSSSLQTHVNYLSSFVLIVPRNQAIVLSRIGPHYGQLIQALREACFYNHIICIDAADFRSVEDKSTWNETHPNVSWMTTFSADFDTVSEQSPGWHCLSDGHLTYYSNPSMRIFQEIRILQKRVLGLVITFNAKFTDRGAVVDAKAFQRAGAKAAVWIQHATMLGG
jgi:hypothetical protein